MGYIVMMVFAVLVCGGIYLGGRYLSKNTSHPDNARDGFRLKVAAGVAFVLWAGLGTFFSSFVQIANGQVGLVKTFGAYTSQVSRGPHLVAPWADVETANVQVQRAKIHLDAFSRETQDVFIDATLNYSVSPGDIRGLYTQVGSDYFNRVIEPRVLQFFKDETVKFRAVDIAPNRDVIRQAVRDRLETALSKYSVQVQDLLIDNIDFPAEFKNAIVRKQVATQDALAAQNRVAQSTAEADQKIAQARGVAQSILIQADAQSTANKKLAASITPELVQYQWVQKISPSVKTILMPNNGNGIILPSSLVGK